MRSYYFTRKANAERERRAAGLPPPGPEEVRHYKAYLQYCRGEIEQYVARLGLRMNKKTNIFPLRNGIDFLGFHTYLTESGKIIRKVRRSSKSNAQRKLKKQRGLLDREKISLSDIEQSYGSWRSHAAKGNCYHLIQKTDSLFQNLFKESEKQWPKV